MSEPEADPVEVVMDLARVFYENEAASREGAENAESEAEKTELEIAARINGAYASDIREVARWLDGEREEVPNIVSEGRGYRDDYGAVPWRADDA